jgi:two-component system response regulator (stage 0 sporulation protein F)
MKGIKLLVVDDQEGIRRLLSETFSLLGYEVETAASGNEALEIIEQDNFKLALVDMKMPGMNGINTIERLLEIRQDLKAILMTGYGDFELSEEKSTAKIDAVIKKPFDLEEIKELIEKVILS